MDLVHSPKINGGIACQVSEFECGKRDEKSQESLPIPNGKADLT